MLIYLLQHHYCHIVSMLDLYNLVAAVLLATYLRGDVPVFLSDRSHPILPWPLRTWDMEPGI